MSRIRRSLPPNIDEPVIQHFDPNDSPIMSIAMQSNERGIRELTDLRPKSVVDPPRGDSGRGRRERERRQPAPDQGAARSERDARLQRSPVQVIQALQRENQEVPGGTRDAR